jgi:hypothetical protein
MTRRLTCTAIATFAVIGALALSGGPASAAATSAAVSGGTQAQLALTPEECSSIRQEIELKTSLLDAVQEQLEHATPSQKGDLMRRIKRLMEEITRLSNQYDEGCPAVYGTPLPPVYGTPLPA